MHSVAELTKNLSDYAAFVKRSFAYAQDDSLGKFVKVTTLVLQGGLMLIELLIRNNIKIQTVIMDVVYVAHQGKITG